MGLSESKLQPEIVRPLVRQDSLTPLPSFTLEAAKLSDGSSGFVVTTIDLAKNSNVRVVSIKFCYSPSDNSIVFVGNDESVFSFVRDRFTGNVVCSVSSVSKENIIRFCVTTYEPLDDKLIDKIGELYLRTTQAK